MATVEIYDQPSGRAELACESCRRRKAKCDRVLPKCNLCDKLEFLCHYPAKRLKPGPKTGSTFQRTNKRRRLAHSQGDDELVSPLTESDGDRPLQGHTTNQSTSMAGQLCSDRQPRSSHEVELLASIDGSIHDTGYENGPFISPDPTLQKDLESEGSEDSDVAAGNFLRAIRLSSIIHPGHEAQANESDPGPCASGYFINLAGAQDLIMQVCVAMNMSIQTLQLLVDTYFDNITAYSLFHQPSFGSKIQDITNLTHLKALFAAMFSLAIRFVDPQDMADRASPQTHSSDAFTNMAVRAIDEALIGCGDERPPLCLLQAMVLFTFSLLIHGVRGRAWRILGACVRVAYELELHLIDYDADEDSQVYGSELTKWVRDEEKRRSWWAIWEMDIFASTIRRCPTAIDGKMNDTFLPVSDDQWFQRHYQSSCSLARKPMDRWKRLKDTGNESPVAWFIVVNSLMRDAQVLARGNFQGGLPAARGENNLASLIQYFRNTYQEKKASEDSSKLDFLADALRCATLAMPEALTCRGELLTFSPGTQDEVKSQSAKYSIHMITELARFMIYHHYAFSEIVSGSIFSGEAPQGQSDQAMLGHAQGLAHCLDAADNILSITTSCSENHFKWVNPFFASTISLAASLQILRRVLTADQQPNLTDSKSGILRRVCEHHNQFWGTPAILLDNLTDLEQRLIRRRVHTDWKSSSQPPHPSTKRCPSDLTSQSQALNTFPVGPTFQVQTDHSGRMVAPSGPQDISGLPLNCHARCSGDSASLDMLPDTDLELGLSHRANDPAGGFSEQPEMGLLDEARFEETGLEFGENLTWFLSDLLSRSYPP